MEAFPLYEMKIKSSLREYEVFFSESIFNALNKTLKFEDFLLIDKNVYLGFSDNVKKLIAKHNHIFITANENQKSFNSLAPIIEQLIINNFRKTNRLIAIGGGITQDIAAFISSIMYRGVEWLFFPTTLLAQADSCIGGKTSINIGKYKNQLGNFYPPQQIFIIPKLLKSLPLLDFKSGMGEMLHFYLVSGKADYEYYQQNYDSAFKDDRILLDLIKRNLEIKKSFIERDEFDQNERQLLNYGHSFGHAIESLTGYSIPHGIAVSYGMDIANFISLKLGFIDIKLYQDIKLMLKKLCEGVPLGKISLLILKKLLPVIKKHWKYLSSNTFQRHWKYAKTWC